MKRIDLDHWFVGDNKLSISLMKFFVRITICKNDDYIFYGLEVYDDNRVCLIFNFYSLEDAIKFTEEVIAKCFEKEEIINAYIEKFDKKTKVKTKNRYN